jgi:phage terminase small subunit
MTEQKAPKTPRKVNARQQLYKKNLILGMSKYAAARAAGYSHNTAVAAKQNIENRLDMAHWLEASGITDKALANTISEGLAADKIVPLGEGESETAPDWQTRHRFVETALKLKGQLKPEEGKGNGPLTLLQIFAPVRKKEAEELAKGKSQAEVLFRPEFIKMIRDKASHGPSN